MTFKLEKATLALLRERVPRGWMTAFVEQALQRALDHCLPQNLGPGHRVRIAQNRASNRLATREKPPASPGITPGIVVNICFDDTRANDAIAARAA
jgi:hypothetical protein